MKKLRLLIDMEKNKFIDYTGLFLIGTLSLGYSLYSSYFAKLHVYLSFIKVPLFVGEIVLLICFFLFLVKWLTNPQELNFFNCLFLFYLGLVIAKTLFGYFRWGPLSLRHSVLFLYPLFAVFSASFYRRDFFKPKNSLFFIFIFFVLYIYSRFFAFYTYSGLTCFMLTLILINAYPKRLLRYSLYSLFFLLFPYRILFNTARTFIVSNLIAITCIIPLFLIISRTKILFKIIFSLFIFLFIFCGLKYASSRSELRSIIGFRELIKAYSLSMDNLRLKEPAFVEEKLSVKLYNEKTAWFQEPSKEQIKKLTEYNSNIKKNLPPRLSTKYDDKIIASLATVNSKDVQPQLNPQAQFMSTSQVQFKSESPSQPKFGSQPQLQLPSQSLARSQSQPQPRAQFRAKPQTQSQFGSQSKLQLPSYPRAELRIQTQSFKQLSDSKEKINTLIKKTNETKAHIVLRERDSDTPNINTLFRFFIWRDAFREFMVKRPMFGFDFGKPFRSRTIEVLRIADGEWSRDGWICFHNSYVNIVYRTGILGIFMTGAVLIAVFLLMRGAIQKRSLTGILLIGILINWFIAANFLEILEMPYSAIPLWSLFGLTSAYLFKNKTQ